MLDNQPVIAKFGIEGYLYGASVLFGSKGPSQEVGDDQRNQPGRARGRRSGSSIGVLDQGDGLRARPGRALWRRTVARGADAGRSRDGRPEPAARRPADRSNRATDVEHHVLLPRPLANVRGAGSSRRRLSAAPGRAAVRIVVDVRGHRGQPLRPHAARRDLNRGKAAGSISLAHQRPTTHGSEWACLIATIIQIIEPIIGTQMRAPNVAWRCDFSAEGDGLPEAEDVVRVVVRLDLGQPSVVLAVVGASPVVQVGVRKAGVDAPGAPAVDGRPRPCRPFAGGQLLRGRRLRVDEDQVLEQEELVAMDECSGVCGPPVVGTAPGREPDAAGATWRALLANVSTRAAIASRGSGCVKNS